MQIWCSNAIGLTFCFTFITTKRRGGCFLIVFLLFVCLFSPPLHRDAFKAPNDVDKWSKGGSVSDYEACLVSFCGTAYWNHKWLNVSQMVLIQVEPGEKLAGRLNIIGAFWLRNKFDWVFFSLFKLSASLLKGKKPLIFNCLLLSPS